MKKKTARKRLEKTGCSKNSIAYKVITDVIEGKNETGLIQGGVIRPCYTSGSGRFTSNQDHTDLVVHCLNKMNVKFTLGNDAPRGGATGRWIEIKTKFKE